MSKDDAQILAEVAELGRMTLEQEQILYRIALRQDELGRQPTNMLLKALEADEDFMALVDREYLTYDVFNKGNPERAVVSVYVTLKGMRYAIQFNDEISESLPVDPAGNKREV